MNARTPSVVRSALKEIDAINRRKEQLESFISSYEKITSGNGLPVAKTSKVGVKTRPKNADSLKEAYLKVLKSNPKGITLEDAVTTILAQGYKTSAADFPKVLGQLIFKMREDEELVSKSRVGRKVRYALSK